MKIKKSALALLAAVLIALEIFFSFALVFGTYEDIGGTLELARAVVVLEKNPSPKAEADLKALQAHVFRPQLIIDGVLCVLVILNGLAIVKVCMTIRTKGNTSRAIS